MKFTIYDDKGKILVSGECLEDSFDYQLPLYPEGVGIINASSSPENDYVLDGEVTPRPKMPLEIDGLTILGVPPNSEITIEDESYPCPDGGDVTLNFQHPGTYIVKVSCFPYLDKEFEIDYQPQE